MQQIMVVAWRALVPNSGCVFIMYLYLSSDTTKNSTTKSGSLSLALDTSATHVHPLAILAQADLLELEWSTVQVLHLIKFSFPTLHSLIEWVNWVDLLIYLFDSGLVEGLKCSDHWSGDLIDDWYLDLFTSSTH